MVNEPIWTRWHPQPHHTIPILLPKWSIKHSTLHNSLAWKYEKVMLLCNQDYKWSGTPGNNIGIVWWGRGCQRAQICSLTMLHVSHPYLVSLSFYTIPIMPLLQVFLFTCTLQLNHTVTVELLLCMLKYVLSMYAWVCIGVCSQCNLYGLLYLNYCALMWMYVLCTKLYAVLY